MSISVQEQQGGPSVGGVLSLGGGGNSGSSYLLPAYRYPANHILLWPLLLLGLTATTGRARTTWLTLSTALLTLHAATWFLPKIGIPWPGIGSLLLACGVAILTFLPARKPPTLPTP